MYPTEIKEMFLFLFLFVCLFVFLGGGGWWGIGYLPLKNISGM